MAKITIRPLDDRIVVEPSVRKKRPLVESFCPMQPRKNHNAAQS